jgi:hypothetical protein
MAISWRLEGSECKSGQRQDFSPLHVVQNGCGAHPVSYSIVRETLSLGVKRPGREANHWRQSSVEVKNIWIYIFNHRSQWPRGLRHELSSLARTLGSLDRIPLEIWIFICVYSVFMLSCVRVSALQRAHPPSKESYLLCLGLKNWKSGRYPTKGLYS